MKLYWKSSFCCCTYLVREEEGERERYGGEFSIWWKMFSESFMSFRLLLLLLQQNVKLLWFPSVIYYSTHIQPKQLNSTWNIVNFASSGTKKLSVHVEMMLGTAKWWRRRQQWGEKCLMFSGKLENALTIPTSFIARFFFFIFSRQICAHEKIIIDD